MSYKQKLPISVVEGATNRSSFTAYGVVCGGTTSTGTLQPTVSAGTSFQALVSNGASALPSYKTINGSNVLTSYTTAGSGTHTLNSKTKWIKIFLISGGSGGGSGRQGTSGASGGGSGGTAGSMFFEASVDMFGGAGASVSYTVGAKGTGGAAQASTSTNGNNGNAGGVSKFGVVQTYPGIGGTGGSTTTVVSANNIFRISQRLSGHGVAGGPGVLGNATDQTDEIVLFYPLGAGGGGGGDSVTAGTGGASGSKVNTPLIWGGSALVTAGAGGATNGAAGGNGSAASTNWFMSGTDGGGGAGGTASVAGGKGGNGGAPGGSGGGGGGSVNGANSGAGGDGADGAIFIVEYL